MSLTLKKQHFMLFFFFLMAALFAFFPEMALAATDGRFSALEDEITGEIKGSGGQAITALSVVWALLGLVKNWNAGIILTPIGIGLTSFFGPDMVQFGSSALI